MAIMVQNNTNNFAEVFFDSNEKADMFGIVPLANDLWLGNLSSVSLEGHPSSWQFNLLRIMFYWESATRETLTTERWWSSCTLCSTFRALGILSSVTRYVASLEKHGTLLIWTILWSLQDAAWCYYNSLLLVQVRVQ